MLTYFVFVFFVFYSTLFYFFPPLRPRGPIVAQFYTLFREKVLIFTLKTQSFNLCYIGVAWICQTPFTTFKKKLLHLKKLYKKWYNFFEKNLIDNGHLCGPKILPFKILAVT